MRAHLEEGSRTLTGVGTYLDHAATTPISERARARLIEVLDLVGGNPSSAHRHGQEAKYLLEQARTELSERWGRRPADVIFVSSATEAMNTAIIGSQIRADQVIVVSPIEHHCVLSALKRVPNEVYWMPIGADGWVHPEVVGPIFRALGDRLGMVVLMGANNETGVIQPVIEVASAARAANPEVIVVSDLVAVAPWEPLAPWLAVADLAAVAGHKVGGPVGCGILVRRDSRALTPRLVGGEQEYGVRAGTVSVGLAVATVEAIAEVEETMPERLVTTTALRDRFEYQVHLEIPSARVTGCDARRTPGISHIVIPGALAEDLLFLLDEEGVSAAAGAACASGALEPSHVLVAMGVPDAEGGVRFSFETSTTRYDVECGARALTHVLAVLDGAERR
ncbi:MAG: cysteine desulfurase family protein [Ferrimicrobium sp.]